MNNMLLARMNRLGIRCSVHVGPKWVQIYMFHGSRQLSRFISWPEVQNGMIEMVDAKINEMLKELDK